MKQDALRIGLAVQNMTMDFSGTGGAALQMTHIIRGLQRRGIRVDLLALRGARRVLFTDDLAVTNYGRLGFSNNSLFKLVESGVRRLQGVVRFPYLGLFDSYRFYDACRQNLATCDVLHERNALYAIGAARAARQMGKPYVLSLDADELFELAYMGKPVTGLSKWMAEWAARVTYRQARAFTCVSPAAKQHFVEKWDLPADKIMVLGNGVDVPFFEVTEDKAAARAQLGLGDEPLVLFVGGFWHWHGLDLLVDSFAAVLPHVPQARLLLVGDGETREQTEQRVQQHDIASSVTFTGRKPHHLVPLYLRAADVCVAPYPHFDTEFWGAPLKIYEYMAAGKAIVASGAGLVVEVVRHEQSGLVAAPGDVPGMTQALTRLLKDVKLRETLGQRAYEQAVAEHSWSNYVSKLEEMYQSVL